MSVREFFPNVQMILLSARYLKSTTRPAQAVFKVPPSMTKHEVKEYLTKIYQLPVKRVMTANFAGRWKRIIGITKMFPYKQPKFKKAFVTFEKGAKLM
mmetsp:Transcript_14222/g.16928  ORF Transcript_14222/g.16928 Transcript_14222/m.16928 type:complete len:98 (+) Transcript_14222:84-377(+)